MKKHLYALGALAAIAGTAQAQSSVTVFGILDVNLRSVTNGDATVRQMGTDGLNSSRLGFRVDEDLGGGLRAGAWLESAVSPDTGSMSPSGKLWHRRSTVSLSGNFGEVRLGRDFAATFLNLSAFDPFGTSGVGSGLNLINNLGSGAATLLRVDNSVSYFLPPTLGGLYGQIEVTAGEGVPGNSYRGARFGYRSGPFNTAVSFGNTHTATSENFKLVNAGVSYNFGVATVMALVNQAKYGVKKQNNWELGVVAPVGVGQVRASYQRADVSGGGADADDARQLAVGYVHPLSKRTSLYGTYSRLTNSGAAAFVVGRPPAAAAGRNSTGYELGIRHSF